MTLEESIEFDEARTNAKIRGLNVTACFENNNREICKECIHGDGEGHCITREEAPFNSFGCVKNSHFNKE